MSRVGSKKRAKNDDPYEKLVAEYRRAPGTGWPATATAIAKWALDNNRAVYSRLTQQQMLAKSIARSMGEEIFTDPQGRKVRKKHCFPKMVETPSGMKRQLFLWCDIETAQPDEFRSAVQYRRRQMVGNAKQLKTDVDSYNANNAAGAEVQLNLNFARDVIEGEMDTEYNPQPLPDDQV